MDKFEMGNERIVESAMAAGRAEMADYWCLFMLPIAETPAPQLSVRAALHYRFSRLWLHVAPYTHAVSDVHQYRNSLALASCTTHSSPSCRFMPVIALQVMMFHL